MTLSHKNCIFFNFLSESLKTDTEDLPDQIETSVQFSQIKAKQIQRLKKWFCLIWKCADFYKSQSMWCRATVYTFLVMCLKKREVLLKAKNLLELETKLTMQVCLSIWLLLVLISANQTFPWVTLWPLSFWDSSSQSRLGCWVKKRALLSFNLLYLPQFRNTWISPNTG